MLEGLFGNSTAERVLTFLAMNPDAYAQQLADRFELSLSVVQNQLRRLERGGIIVSQPKGRMRFYSFNPRFPLRDDLRAMLKRAADLLPDKERAKYIVRNRPRMKGKPL
jgi:DNA-binding transcriptional ArsR family regulator